MKIYELPENDDYAQKPIPWKGNFNGAYWDSEIKDGYIICYDYDQDKKEKIIAERYKIQKNSAMPVESKNKFD